MMKKSFQNPIFHDFPQFSHLHFLFKNKGFFGEFLLREIGFIPVFVTIIIH